MPADTLKPPYRVVITLPKDGEPSVDIRPKEYASGLTKPYVDRLIEKARQAAIDSDFRPEVETSIGTYRLLSADFSLRETSVTYCLKISFSS